MSSHRTPRQRRSFSNAPFRAELFLLAGGAEAEEFEFVSDGGEAVAGGDLALEVLEKTILDLDDGGAIGANEVVVMFVFLVADQFVTGDGIAEVEALDELDFFQEMDRAIDRGEVAIVSDEGVDFADSERVGLGFEGADNGEARAGKFARFFAETFGDRLFGSAHFFRQD